MSFWYARSLASDFGGVAPRHDQLYTEMNADQGIGPNFLGLFRKGDAIRVYFDDTLSAGEETAMDVVIADHDPQVRSASIDHMLTHNFHSNNKPFIWSKSINWVPIDSFSWPGTEALATPIEVKALVQRSANNGTSQIRVYDSTNGKEILTSENYLSWTTNARQEVSSTTFNNVSTKSAIWETQLRRSAGNGFGYVYNITFTFKK